MEQKHNEQMAQWIEAVEAQLRQKIQVSEATAPQRRVIEAMRYSLEAGGKRIRPVLVLAFCEMCGGSWNDALPAACALEMVHTYSLIHDDLPEMDNDDYRRGRLSCHKAFDTATALLAGDALLTEAFAVLTTCPNQSPETLVRLVQELAAAIGAAGMIGGQVLDMAFETRSDVTQAELEQMEKGKTSALLRAACRIGCLVGGGTEAQLACATVYAENLGLAFQIVDDILDVTSTTETLGKPVGSDAASGKVTFATLLGLKEAQARAEAATQAAKQALADLPNPAFLLDLTDMLLDRKK